MGNRTKEIKQALIAQLRKTARWKPPTDRAGTIRLDLNENPDVSGMLSAHTIAETMPSDTWNRYPEYDTLLEQLSAYTKLPKQMIALANGSDHAIQLLFLMYFGNGARVIMPSPVFSIYHHLAKIFDTDIQLIAYRNTYPSFSFPVEETIAALETGGVNGLILCNPNNPLGSPIPNTALQHILSITAEKNIPTLVDEAYFEYAPETTSAPYLMRYPNVMITRSFSKAFGCAGLRLGYVLAAPEIIDAFLTLRLPWSVSGVAAHVGTVVLKHQKSILALMPDFQNRRKEFTEFLRGTCGLQAYDSCTNAIIVRVDKPENFLASLKKSNILANHIFRAPGAFGMLDNAIRINIPTHKDMGAVKNAFRQYTE